MVSVPSFEASIKLLLPLPAVAQGLHPSLLHLGHVGRHVQAVWAGGAGMPMHTLIIGCPADLLTLNIFSMNQYIFSE